MGMAANSHRQRPEAGFASTISEPGDGGWPRREAHSKRGKSRHNGSTVPLAVDAQCESRLKQPELPPAFFADPFKKQDRVAWPRRGALHASPARRLAGSINKGQEPQGTGHLDVGRGVKPAEGSGRDRHPGPTVRSRTTGN